MVVFKLAAEWSVLLLRYKTFLPKAQKIFVKIFPKTQLQNLQKIFTRDCCRHQQQTQLNHFADKPVKLPNYFIDSHNQ